MFSQRLDRAKPLWEIWLVDRVGGDRFALISKTHHALVDGVSGVDITTVLFDLEPDPPRRRAAPRRGSRGPSRAAPRCWPTRSPSARAAPLELARAAADALAHPRARRRRRRGASPGSARWPRAGLRGAPPSPLNVRDRPAPALRVGRRRPRAFKAIKDALGGTVNDVVLTVVAGALRAHLRRRGRDPNGVELKAMVPVSVRADAERGALGNRVAAMYAPLPVGARRTRSSASRFVHEAMGGLKESGQAVGAEALTRLADFAPPTVLAQAARLQSRQRFFNLTVTNVPGPAGPALHARPPAARVLSRRCRSSLNTALGIAIMSYDGQLFFGLLGDYDAMADLDALAADLDARDRRAGGGGRRPPARAPAAARSRRGRA